MVVGLCFGVYRRWCLAFYRRLNSQRTRPLDWRFWKAKFCLVYKIPRDGVESSASKRAGYQFCHGYFVELGNLPYGLAFTYDLAKVKDMFHIFRTSEESVKTVVSSSYRPDRVSSVQHDIRADTTRATCFQVNGGMTSLRVSSLPVKECRLSGARLS